ncbi:Gfo/Idh/MocA family protein [Microbacterium saperdae]
MSTSPSLGIAIIGVGGIAESHMAALKMTDRAHLVCVQDMDAARARHVAIEQGCRAVATLDDVFECAEVGAVIVCTPNRTHEEIGMRVLDTGRHLLMEKPLAMTVEGAERLAAAADDAGLVMAVGHSHRFSAQSMAINDVIRSGDVGEPRFVRIVMNGGWIWPGWQAWVLDPELSGGHALHNGVHLTDLATWWIGEKPSSVFAVGQKVTSRALDIADYLVVQLRFPNGAAAICEVSRAERPRQSSYLEMTVVGSEGVVSRSWDADGIRAWTEEGMAMWSPAGTSDDVFVRELEGFVDAVDALAPVVPPVVVAVDAVRVATAAELSLRSGRVVQLQGGLR